MIRKPNATDHLLLAAIVLMFSQSFVSLRIVVPELGTLWTITIRVSIALVVLLPWAVWRGFEWPKGTRNWSLVIALSVLNVVLPFSLFTWAIKYLAAGQAALIFGAIPLLGLTVSHFTTSDDRFTIFKFAGVCLGLTGIGTLFGVEVVEGSLQTLMAYSAMLLTAFSYALSGGIIRKLADHPPVRLITLIYMFALPVFLLFTFLSGEPRPQQVSTWALGNLIFLGLFPSGLAYILRFKLIPIIGLSYYSLAMNFLPVTGVVFGALILSEPITIPMVAALLLILAGLLTSRIKAR